MIASHVRTVLFGALATGCAAAGPRSSPLPHPAPAGADAEAITPGSAVTGRLTLTDPQFRDGSRYHRYDFTARQGDTITFTMASDDFDANLIVTDRFGNPVAHDDDGGGDCNAWVTFVPRATGSHHVYANSSAQAELGEYRLQMSAGRGTAAVGRDSTCRGFGKVRGLILPGESVDGELTDDDPEMSSDSSHFQRWVLPLTEGQTVTIDLGSDVFDAFLMVTRGRGDKLVENDDGGGECNARVVYTATDDHPVRVIVNTVKGRVTGRYTLKVTTGALAVAPDGDCREDRGLRG